MNAWYSEEIAYCANVHPGTRAIDIENNIKKITVSVKRKTGLNTMVAGLWLSDEAANEYLDENNRKRLKATLKQAGLRAFTFNGFPQNDFHQEVVKHDVYTPNWASVERLKYTKTLATILADLLPEDIEEGTISSLPLGYRLSWTDLDWQAACENIAEYLSFAQSIHEKTGKRIRLCLEMEPGCVLERTHQVIDFFTSRLKQTVEDRDLASELISDYLGLCYDICHQAVMQENIHRSIQEIVKAGIVIGKVQVSAALKIEEVSNNTDLLNSFAEPKYLHQTTTIDDEGTFVFEDDLEEALKQKDFPKSNPWWIHFHIPIQTDQIYLHGTVQPGAFTTRAQIEEFFDAILLQKHRPQIEIETYTWHVLPEEIRPKSSVALVAGLVREYQWLRSLLNAKSLLRN